MNEENFEKIYYISRFIRNDHIKESRQVKEDKFFKVFINLINENYSEYYKILFYKFLNPCYLITDKNLEDFKKMRNKIKDDISKYLLYLIDYDIYFLENKLAIFNHNRLESAVQETKI